MRYGTLVEVWVAACDGGSNAPPPHAAKVADARMADARMVDAFVLMDAPFADSTAITTACTNLCAALATCFMERRDDDCVAECSADLADCTAEQVMTLDACKSEDCGDEDDSPFFTCITAVSGVDG